MTFRQKLIIVGIAGLVVLLLDQGTKIWARAALLTPVQRRALVDENPELYAKGELAKTRDGKRYRVHPYDPTRGKRKIKPIKRDGKKTFSPVVGDRPGTRMWFILSFNPGAAFGLFNDTAGSRVFLSIIGLLALALIFYLLRRPESDSKLFVWALALVAGGAVGNLIDRIVYGVVTDFIWVWLTPSWKLVWPWPAFNIADIALVVGVGLMVPAMLFTKSPEDEEAGDKDAQKGALKGAKKGAKGDQKGAKKTDQDADDKDTAKKSDGDEAPGDDASQAADKPAPKGKPTQKKRRSGKRSKRK